MRLTTHLVVVVLFIFSVECLTTNLPYLMGVNLAGLDFASGKIPGIFQKDYTVGTSKEVDYYTSKGFNLFRIPFLWERLQPIANAEFNSTQMTIIDGIVSYATSKGAYVLIDPHNYARYHGEVIGSPNSSATVSVFQDFWRKLATHYKDNDHIIFGLMNEPNGMATELWFADAQAAISAIRGTGATQVITVPGNGYTGAHSWTSNWYGTPNSVAMLGLVDPLNNFIFEMHQYFDSDSSGTNPICVSAATAVDRLNVSTTWLRNHQYKGLIGEWAGSSNADCTAAINAFLNHLKQNSDVWVGSAWWAGGPWWGDAWNNLDAASDGSDRPQMQILVDSLKNSSITPTVSFLMLVLTFVLLFGLQQ